MILDAFKFDAYRVVYEGGTANIQITVYGAIRQCTLESYGPTLTVKCCGHEEEFTLESCGGGMKKRLDWINQCIEKVAYHECKFVFMDRVRKISGSQWQGLVVGFYQSSLTKMGVCVESELHPGSVQIYPQEALELVI